MSLIKPATYTPLAIRESIRSALQNRQRIRESSNPYSIPVRVYQSIDQSGSLRRVLLSLIKLVRYPTTFVGTLRFLRLYSSRAYETLLNALETSRNSTVAILFLFYTAQIFSTRAYIAISNDLTLLPPKQVSRSRAYSSTRQLSLVARIDSRYLPIV